MTNTLSTRVGLLVTALLVAALTWPNAARAASERKLDLSTPSPRMDAPKPKQTARPRRSTSCAEFGPGFVRLPGSDSCMRIGGGVEMGVGAVP